MSGVIHFQLPALSQGMTGGILSEPGAIATGFLVLSVPRAVATGVLVANGERTQSLSLPVLTGESNRPLTQSVLTRYEVFSKPPPAPFPLLYSCKSSSSMSGGGSRCDSRCQDARRIYHQGLCFRSATIRSGRTFRRPAFRRRLPNASGRCRRRHKLLQVLRVRRNPLMLAQQQKFLKNGCFASLSRQVPIRQARP